MPVNVYAWPPVGIVAAEWSVEAPISTSRSMINGRRFVSAVQRRRRVASMTVSSLSRGGYGGGYMEALKRALDGGTHLVRLTSMGINDREPVDPSVRRGEELSWRAASGTNPVTWDAGTGPGRLSWFVGEPLFADTQTAVSASVQSITVPGLPPNTTIAWPGEFITIVINGVPETHMVSAPSTSSSVGTARIKLLTRPSGLGRVIIGSTETAVFEAMELPRVARPLGENWFWDWSFREVFEDEVPGGFVEINPWI